MIEIEYNLFTAGEQTQEWYIVEKWVAGEKRSHIRRGDSLDAVYQEEVAAGVDVINVITV
jgi:hypothetical protein